MEFTQQEQEVADSRQQAHENTQLVSLQTNVIELLNLKNYAEKESKLLDEKDSLSILLSESTTMMDNLIQVCEKCKRSYHFGCEILLYFIGKVINNEGRAIKDSSSNYSSGIQLVQRFTLFSNLHSALESIPYHKYAIESVPSTLKQVLASPTEYKEIVESVKSYLDIGDALKDEAIMELIKTGLKDLRHNSSAVSFYAAIIGPSFMGKTQTAFTLSHTISVLYMNLLIGTNTDYLGVNQKIYQAFFSFSRILNNIIDDDLHNINNVNGDINASDFDKREMREISFRILGLIFVLIKLRMQRSDITIFEWYKSIIDIKKVCIPKMTVDEFQIIVRGINLDKVVVFIDELARDPDNEKRTKFTRNICRIVQMPVILSGTNARVNNLIGVSKYFISGLSENFRLWVKIICELCKSTLKSLGRSVKFKGADNNLHYLSEFVVIDGSGDAAINYNELFNVLLTAENRITSELVPDLRKLFEMLFEQSKTNLPGIAYTSISKALNLISENLIDAKSLFKEVALFVSKALSTRKVNLKFENGLISSLHTLTFPSLDLKNIHERGKLSEKKVDSHYFYYGKKDEEKIFDLKIFVSNSLVDKTINISQLFRSETIEHVDSCHFPELKNDVLLNIGCWQVFWNLINDKKRIFTIGHLYQDYLESGGNFDVESLATVPDSFSLELLAHWCICYAAHKNLNGYTAAEDVLKEFLINVQNRVYKALPQTTPVDPENRQLIFKFDLLPTSLSNFLAKISIPYLVQSDSFTNNFAEFIRMGESNRLMNAEGWDVKFDLYFENEVTPRKGYIECKVLKDGVGLPQLKPYYEKAGLNGHKLSIMLVKNLQKSMQGEAASKKMKMKAEPTKTTDYAMLFDDLWKNPQYHINLYSAALENNTNTFKFGTLQEFENPAGVFILVQTDFNPLHRSARD